MPFALLADEFHSDPKTIKAGLAGAGLYARALSYCGHYLTDGFVPLAWVKEIATPAIRRKVTEAGFWVNVTGGETYHYVSGAETYIVTIVEPGFFIPNYLAFNPTRKSVLEKRSELSAKRSDAGKKGAAARWQRHTSDDGTKARARNIANTAQKAGRLIPEPCEDCGALEVVKHHEDYDRPEDVTWLCHSCHSNRHSNGDGKSMATPWQADSPLPLPSKDPKAVTTHETPEPDHDAEEQPRIIDFKIPTPHLREMPAA